MLVPELDRPAARRAKVLDFGIAKLSGQTDGKVQTETGTMIGTPAYMAPEQCMADPNLDGKADVYALGIMFYEMLADRLPFEARHGFDFMAAHVRTAPRPLRQVAPQVPDEVADLVHSMMAKAPSERPSMEVVVAILDRLRAALSAVWAAPLGAAASSQQDRDALEFSNTAAQASTDAGRAKVLALGATVPGSATASGRVSKDSLQPLLKAASTSNPVISRSSMGGATPLPAAQVSAVSELTVPARARRGVLGIVAVLALAATVGGLVVLRTAGHSGDPVPASTTGSAAGLGSSVPPRQVRWIVSSVPAAAEVVRADGHVLGSTPWELDRPAEPGESILTLRHPGYKDKSILLGHSTDVRTEIHLEAESLPPAAGVPASEPAAADKGSATGKKHRNRSAAAAAPSGAKDKPKGSPDKDVELLE